MIWRKGRVLARRTDWPGAVQLQVEITDAPDNAKELLPPETVTALAYPDLIGEIVIGQSVLIEASALLKKLGTGAGAMVVGTLDRLPPDHLVDPGHIVKARYCSIQPVVLGVDEPESPQHSQLCQHDDLEQLPVVCADLHSALPAIIAGVRSTITNPRIAYIWPDCAALPVWFSRQCASLRESGWIQSVISAGQSFGGDYEAATIPSALLCARHVVRADVAIIIQGPGNLGTDTPFGFSGVSVAEHLNNVAALHGQAIASLRMSHCDGRQRHRGISHHSTTALGKLTWAPTKVPVPNWQGLPLAQFSPQTRQELTDSSSHFRLKLAKQLETLRQCANLQLVQVSTNKLGGLFQDCPVPLQTMGRSWRQDPAQFFSAGTAGILAGKLAQNLPSETTSH